MNLERLTDKWRFGWFAVKQDLSPALQWAEELKHGNICARIAWENGPRVGEFTDKFFKRNLAQPRISTGKNNKPGYVQLISAQDSGEAMQRAIQVLKTCCVEAEHGTWKIFLVDAYTYLTRGLNQAPHVRCVVKVGEGG